MKTKLLKKIRKRFEILKVNHVPYDSDIILMCDGYMESALYFFGKMNKNMYVLTDSSGAYIDTCAETKNSLIDEIIDRIRSEHEQKNTNKKEDKLIRTTKVWYV